MSGLGEILRLAAVKVKEGACALSLLFEREDSVVMCVSDGFGRKEGAAGPTHALISGRAARVRAGVIVLKECKSLRPERKQ